MMIRPYRPADEVDVIALWTTCGLVRPWNDPKKDITRKLAVNAEWFLVAVDEADARIVGTVMAGYEGHRGWINYLAVDPSRRRNGLGRTLMDEAEKCLRSAGCPKINLQVRTTNADVIAFYRQIGFATDDVVSLGKRLEID
jgi:ribosomal protein S18 acetylase RimI-like enzyme